MSYFSNLVFFSLLCSFGLFGEIVDTFYGPIDVQEEVLIDLIRSPAMQRLKKVHQYGVAFYTTHKENYTRYDHSVGVFALLRLKGARLEEQIAGLLHDVSHTAFSHVGDWVFGKEFQDQDYQSTIHSLYLTNSGIAKILEKHGYGIDQFSISEKSNAMLEKSLPDLCADRLDYNIQGAFYQNALSREECQALTEHLTYTDGRWVLPSKELAAKLARFSVFMTEDCWGSAENYVLSKWLAEAILRGIKTGLLSWSDLHFGTDQAIWDALSGSKDPVIQNRMSMLANPKNHYRLAAADDAAIRVRFRCRGIDPWIKNGDSVEQLSSLDPEYALSLQKLRERSAEGWPIAFEPVAAAPLAVH